MASSVSSRWTSVVVGAGVFGAWTAWNLLQRGERVLLVDAWGAAHANASSGGESRITRTVYGGDELYTRMAWESLPEWRWLSGRLPMPLFHETGTLIFFPKVEPYVTQSIEVHRQLDLSIEALGRAEMAERFPQVNWDGIEIGLYEAQVGVLMARRAVQSLVAEFVSSGGEYRTASVTVQEPALSTILEGLQTRDGERFQAERYVFACGAWLPKMFPALLGARIFPTRQEVFYFAPAAEDFRFQAGRLPTWSDFNNGDIYYGTPDIEGRGFKIAHDRHGPRIDVDADDRQISVEGLADVRSFMQLRFPALSGRPLVDSRVCQYENSSNGDFLIDRHPDCQNVWLIGCGSGHGFKHGPAVGRYAADLVTGNLAVIEPRFSLESKATVQRRVVH